MRFPYEGDCYLRVPLESKPPVPKPPSNQSLLDMSHQKQNVTLPLRIPKPKDPDQWKGLFEPKPPIYHYQVIQSDLLNPFDPLVGGHLNFEMPGVKEMHLNG